MKFEKLPLTGAFMIHAEPASDERGSFARIFCQKEFSKQGLLCDFPQHSISFNRSPGTLRGLHYQDAPQAETKVVRCTRGSVFDVIVDIRKESEQFGQWYGVELSESKACSLYVPKGFAHGFITLEENTEITYMIGPEFKPGFARAIRWNDPDLAIAWPVMPEVISSKDREALLLREVS